VQWVTAGRGIVHAEMFPLLAADKGNPLELFQIWLNLPASAKLAEPHFTMFWNEQLPRRVSHDAAGRKTELTLVAGRFDGTDAPAPPPASWAARADADVAIWTLRMEPGATWTLPAARGDGTRRSLYFFKGEAVTVAGRQVNAPAAITLRADAQVTLAGGATVCELLLLQGRPIGEPVAHHGPFVMNTQQELVQAVQDYRETQFGGWQFDDPGPVHGREPRRFAKYPDGREESPAG
jgi:redox-sensitive bicupin YhaK (pirin superfamily)